ncbi:hypothetical protein [Actinoallomurus acaciae]|uniref:Uncharacterized protein n=1 Tax=Actinoallomurus acaciae TaxID=502577 RepID=A0ABV5YTS5_9ACTN
MDSLAGLNALIDQWDTEDDQRRIGSRARTVGEYFAIEQPLPDEPFPIGRVTTRASTVARRSACG